MAEGPEKIYLDPKLGVPLYRQIVDGIRIQVATDVLKEGQKLPPLRTLAIRLRVNPSSVARAYRELVKMGILLQSPRKGTFVNPEPDVHVRDRKKILGGEVHQLISKAFALGFTRKDVLEVVKKRLG